MFVHQSPRRHSARLQNAYEDGTDEDEQHLLQPTYRYDRRRSDFGRQSSPQDQHPRHTQLHTPVRKFADRQSAASDVPFGPYPDASRPAYSAGERCSGTEHADSAYSAGAAALPPSTHRDAKPSADAACQTEHRYLPQHPLLAPDPGGGRGLSSLPSEPTESHADREQKSAFYRNADYQPSTSAKPPPLVLPELPIPKFSGDIRTYPVFRNRFLETFGGRSDLEPRHMFQHLLTCLDGQPLHLANGYLITDVNYFKLLDRLEDRYGDKAILALALSKEFVNLTPVQQTVKDLRRFHDEALRLSDEMQQIGQNVDDILWRQTLLSKMPPPLLTKIYEKLGKDPMTTPVHEILARISDYVRILERVELSDAITSPAENHSEPSDVSDPSDLLSREDPEPPPTEPAVDIQRVAAAVATTRAEEQLRERRTCPLCGLLHSAADCTVYDTTKQRLRQVLKLHLCLLCLREGHPAVSCPRRTTRPCKICRHGQHNRALCKDVADDNNRNGSRPSPVRATKGSSFDPEASDQQRHSRTSAPATTSRRVAEPSVNRDVTCFVATATTLCQSGTQSSRGGNSGNLMDRKKKTKDPGTDPHGRPGTNRRPTTSTDEGMKQKGADAFGGDRLLSGRYHPLQTDRCSNNREMMRFDRTQCDGSDGVPGGMRTRSFLVNCTTTRTSRTNPSTAIVTWSRTAHSMRPTKTGSTTTKRAPCTSPARQTPSSQPYYTSASQ